MANRALPWEQVPEEWKEQFWRFVPADLHFLVRHRAVTLKTVVTWLRASKEEIERRFTQDRRSAAKWMFEQEKEALICYPTELGEITRPSHEADKEVDRVLLWHGPEAKQNDAEPTVENTGTPEDAPPDENRWRSWINWQMARYFFKYEVTGRNVPIGGGEIVHGLENEMLIDGPLLILEVPRDEGRNERAVRIARELTAPDADGREDYRLKMPYVEGKPNLSKALYEKVSYSLGVGPNRTRDILVEGGFELPDDLTWNRKPES